MSKLSESCPPQSTTSQQMIIWSLLPLKDISLLIIGQLIISPLDFSFSLIYLPFFLLFRSSLSNGLELHLLTFLFLLGKIFPLNYFCDSTPSTLGVTCFSGEIRGYPTFFLLDIYFRQISGQPFFALLPAPCGIIIIILADSCLLP